MQEVIIIGVIFLFTFFLIVWERIHRAVSSMVGATLMVVYGLRNGVLTHEEIYSFIDLDTLILLLGMMIIVGVLRDTGIFQWMAIKIAKFTRGNLWYLMVSLSMTSAFLSMFFDNVTTILMMVPVTIYVARGLEVPATPLILAEVLFSNIGGVATLIGDPPNILIASAAGFSFNDFLWVLFPIVFGSLIMSLLILRLIFHRWIRSPYVVMRSPKNVLGFRLSDVSLNIDEHEAIKDKKTMYKGLFIFFLTLYLFLAHDKIGLHPAMVAIIGATLTLLVNHSDPRVVFEKVEWPTLIFFACLFILVGTVEKVEILPKIGAEIISLTKSNQLITSVVVLWLGALSSALIDNIPFTAAIIPAIQAMGGPGVSLDTIWWALAIGVGFGGNASMLGSSASIIAIGFSEKFGEKITFRDWLMYCTPVMVVSTATATILFVIRFFFL
ncbi:MAG: ArsB/NhaD family transporter [Candidatus Altiarchaeota archaeon]